MWPETVDAGDGLVLRAPDPVDAEGVAAAINRSLEHLRPFMEWATERTTVDQQAVRLAVAAEARAAGGDALYTILLNGEVVGGIGLHGRQGPDAVEIGYWVAVGHQRRGIVTRSVRALVDVVFGVDRVDRVIIRCDEANIRSAAVPRRLGFTLVRVDGFDPVAPGQIGRMQVWELRRASPG